MSEIKESKTESKKCNFYNCGFCYKGSDCKFMHPHEVCESYENSGTCDIKRGQKKYVNLESGCARGGLCDFSHRNKPTVINKEGGEESIEVDLIEASQDEPKTKRLGV